jgi:hypothetical protein
MPRSSSKSYKSSSSRSSSYKQSPPKPPVYTPSSNQPVYTPTSNQPVYTPTPSNKPTYTPPPSNQPKEIIVKQESPSLFSSIQQGFGFGMGSALAHNIFNHHPKPTPVKPITTETTTESYTQNFCNEIQNQFTECDFNGSCNDKIKYDFKQCQIKGFLN